MTKRQLNRIARIYAGSILVMQEADFCDLPQNELDYIAKSVTARGKRIAGKDPTFPHIDHIVKYVIDN